MARIDASVLKDAIRHVNDRLAVAGSDHTYRYRCGNGTHIVDVYKGERNMRIIGMGTPKECISAMYSDGFDRLSDLLRL